MAKRKATISVDPSYSDEGGVETQNCSNCGELMFLCPCEMEWDCECNPAPCSFTRRG